jgi:prepilin-type N-terminal cleavage/methylation domain-containing protein
MAANPAQIHPIYPMNPYPPVSEIQMMRSHNHRRGFTMIEIAISLAIVAVAMVAILGILPAGLNVQRENREDTIIDLEADYYLQLIRSSGMQFGPLFVADHVDQISVTRTNHSTRAANTVLYNRTRTTGLGFSWNSRQVIRKLLSTPSWDLGTVPSTPDAVFTPAQGLSIIEENEVRAIVRAIPGRASDLSPAYSDSALRYEMKVSIHPAVTPSIFSGYGQNNTASPAFNNLNSAGPSGQGELLRQAALSSNLWEVELEIRWPVNNFDPVAGTYSLGRNSRTYRTYVAGTLEQDPRSRNLFVFNRGQYQTQ